MECVWREWEDNCVVLVLVSLGAAAEMGAGSWIRRFGEANDQAKIGPVSGMG